MNTNLLFDFLVDKENNTLIVRREFAAAPELVWAAYTQSELLDQWFAPKPWSAVTKHMDFRPGGYWLYAMRGPEGEEHWSRMDYEKVEPITSYTGRDSFCDADGNINNDLPSAIWYATFDPVADYTLVQTVVAYPALEDLEAIIKMGMKDGLTLAMEGLDEVLLTLSKKA